MIQQVVRTALYEEIVKQLLALIKSGQWAPGDQLPGELEFAERFGVSRNCIREALKAMSLSGIVQARPGKGTFVTQDALAHITTYELTGVLSSGSSLAELMEARIVVESQLAGLAATRANDLDKQRITRAYENLKQELLSREQDGLSNNPSEAGTDFHMMIMDAAKNKLLLKFLSSIKGELEAQRARLLLQKTEVALMIDDHTRIYDAIMDRDAEEASRAMSEHLQHTYEIILAHSER